MSEPVISVNKLGKRYRIGVKIEEDRSFREALLNTIKAPINNLKRLRSLTNFNDNKNTKSLALNSSQEAQSDDTIWALKDVSFEVNKGEVVGIIGKNGSGKSTLLKILSRITEPTTGCVDIKGRVSSLLEVGTGFHPELTGRENIYLNGSILGMRKWEITKKFDEIVAFSEIEKFLDTPVKRYSSGMYVRLAFAVAAHLEPEILLVDEVLAVGDIAFQKKCLGKMSDIAKGGRTVLFVSHNMQVISNFCQRAILLKEGSAILDGSVLDIVNNYLVVDISYELNGKLILNDYPGKRIGTGSSRFEEIELIGASGQPQKSFQVGENITIKFVCNIYELKEGQFYQFRIRSSQGIPIYHWVDFDDHLPSPNICGRDSVSLTLKNINLYPGTYYISIMSGDRYGTAYDYLEDVLAFDVINGGIVTLSRQYFPSLGIVHKVPSWKREKQIKGTD